MNSKTFFSKTCNELRKGYTVKELKEICRAEKLPMTGNKDDLCKRLTKHFKDMGNVASVVREFENLNINTVPDTVSELKEMCQQEGLKVSGTKAELCKRLENNAIEQASDFQNLPPEILFEIIKQKLMSEGLEGLEICKTNKNFNSLCKKYKKKFLEYAETWETPANKYLKEMKKDVHGYHALDFIELDIPLKTLYHILDEGTRHYGNKYLALIIGYSIFYPYKDNLYILIKSNGIHGEVMTRFRHALVYILKRSNSSITIDDIERKYISGIRGKMYYDEDYVQEVLDFIREVKEELKK